MKRKKLLYISLCTHMSHICTYMCTCVPVHAHKHTHTHTHVYEGGTKTYRLNYPKLSTFKSEIHKNLIGFNLHFYLDFFDYRDLLVCVFTWQVCKGQDFLTTGIYLSVCLHGRCAEVGYNFRSHFFSSAASRGSQGPRSGRLPWQQALLLAETPRQPIFVF